MKDYIPYVALVISVFSLSCSIYVALRDRANLKASCRAIRHHETGEYAYLDIKIANHGRRPAILKHLRGIYDNGSVAGLAVDNNVVLSEGAIYETKIGKFDGMMVYQDIEDNMHNLISLYFEDSVGKKHPVKGSKDAISQLWSSKHKFGIRTHS